MAIKKIKPDYFAGIFVLLIFVILTFYNWSLLDILDSYFYRIGSKLVHSEARIYNEVIIINIDEKKINKYPENSKLPHINLADLAGRLHESGVKFIACFFPIDKNRSVSTLKELRRLYEEVNAYPAEKSNARFSEWVLQKINEVETRIVMESQTPDTIKDESGLITHGSKEKIRIKTLDYEQVMGVNPVFSDLKDRAVIINFKAGDGPYAENIIKRTDAEIIIMQFINTISSHTLFRPPSMIYLESFILILIICFLIPFTSSKGHMIRALSVLVIILLLMGLVLLCFRFTGMWLRSANIICGIVLLYLFLSVINARSKEEKLKSQETSRILGLNLQSQGELDLAYEEFKTLPLNNETKDLIYNLGLEYEKKKMTGKALELYTYINKTGGFRDLNDRISMLKESDHSSTVGRYGDKDDSSVLSDSSVNTRTMVGRYKIIGKLGRGSMGLVYKAQDPKINRLVAIKTIRFSDEFDEDVIKEIKKRFFMEAEIAGKLSHPAIVTIHDVGDDRDLTYMAMEYLEGEDLDKFIKKENLLPIRTVLDVVAQIAEALDFAHRKGVIHRDIKPANVMLLKNGQVKVTDFGIAKAISSSKTKTGVILGTPNYMSPEQIMGQKIDSRSDIFSLGVLFYQLLTGELPFHGDNLSGLLYQITQVKHSSPRKYNPKMPKICEQILDKALIKDPSMRFRSAGDLANILRILIEKMDQLRSKRNGTE